MPAYCLREGTYWRHGRASGLAPNSKQFAMVLHLIFGYGLKTPSPAIRGFFAGVWEAAFQCCRAPRELGLFLRVVAQGDGDDKP